MIKNKIFIYAILCSTILLIDSQHVDALQRNDNANISEYSKGLSSSLKEKNESTINNNITQSLNKISSKLKRYSSQYSVSNIQCKDSNEIINVSVHFTPDTSVRIMSIIDIRDKMVELFKEQLSLNKNIHIYFIDDDDGHVICDYIYDVNSGWDKKVKS